MAKENKEGRISFISFLQFIGVISVILGHSINGMQVAPVFKDIKEWIYTYHMPLFFFVSAFLFSCKGGYGQGYKNVLGKRFYRLIIPYFIWNVAFIIPKYVLLPYLDGLSKDAPIEFSLMFFIRIILRPRDNILGHTWFLFALFEMFIIAILLDKAKGKKPLIIPVFLLLIVVNCLGVDNRWFSIGDLMKNAVFFWGGLLLGTRQQSIIEKNLKNKYAILLTGMVVIGSTIIWIWHRDWLINTLVLGFSLLFFFMIIQMLIGIDGGIIEFVSKNSFPIYIMHWPTIMVVRFLFYQMLKLPSILAMLLNILLGLAIPCVVIMIIKRLRVPWIRKIGSMVFGMRE